MARSTRAFPLAVALGAALAVPAAGLTPSAVAASSGGAAPTASLTASGGAPPDGLAGSQNEEATSAQTGGAVPGRRPLRRGARTPPRRRAAPPRRAAPRRRAVPPASRPPPAAPEPAPDAPPSAPDAPTVGGRFPIAGAFDLGGGGARFGAGRPGHTHQGHDVIAASGTPVIAPVAGTVTWKAYQPSAAGVYLVVRGSDGRDYVFMHLKRGSVLVAAGDAVAAGQQLAQVGATGIASGPHLHFEIWVGGWQQRGGAPVDPLPQLERWAAGV